MGIVRGLAAIGGFAVIGGTASSVLRTLVVPRGITSSLSERVLDTVVRLCRMAGKLTRSYERRDQVLAWAAPLALMSTLLSWLLAFWLGFSLDDYAFSPLNFTDSMRQAGSSIATLGFATTPHAGLTTLDVVASLTGMIVVALQIAYLPTLYSAYNRRETLVTVLAGRAGEPSWGPEILARHAWLGLLESLPELYREWEQWAATVSESHTSYPILIHFRSPQPLRSWLVSLLGVMDAAAMHLALAPTTAPIGARLLLRMGYLTLRDIATVESIPVRAEPSPDDDIQLTQEEFDRAVLVLAGTGFPIERGAREAWPHFRGWRVNYEDAAYGIAMHIDAVPAPWSGPRRRPEEQIVPRRPENRQPTRGLEGGPTA
jgi:hypothetical protein